MQEINYGKRQGLIDIFLEMNTKINLSAIRDAEGVYQKHILDSLEISKIFEFLGGESLLDVGTGGGFPLLPLAIEFPHLQCTGLDATKKKCSAIEQMAEQLGLQNVSLLWGRAEEIQGAYDLVTSRAVGFAEKLFPWTVKFAKRGGYIVWRKMWTEEEDKYIMNNFKKYKVELESVHRYHLENDPLERVLYVMRKKN